MNNKEFGIISAEISGRGAISVLAAIGINRTQWYQNLNPLNLMQPYIWTIAICVCFVGLWIFLPMIKYNWNFALDMEGETK